MVEENDFDTVLRELHMPEFDGFHNGDIIAISSQQPGGAVTLTLLERMTLLTGGGG